MFSDNVLFKFILEEYKLLAILTICFMLYFYYTSTFTFFQEKGIKYMQPTILLGNMGPRILAKKGFHEFQKDIYFHFKGQRLGGFFEGRRPVLYIFDPNLLKAVLIKDFDHFVDRNNMRTNEPNYLKRSLLNLKGAEWKAVRSILTHTFSPARLRNMLPLIERCSNQMVDLLKQEDRKRDIEMKDFMGHFTLEVIGTCAFGVEGQSNFVEVAEKFAHMSKMKRFVIFFFLILMPKAMRFFNISFMNRESTDELIRILNVTKAERRKSNSQKRSDFLQILLDAAIKEKEESSNNTTHLDEDTIDAQSLLFLIAGYETSSSALSFAIHVLATRPDLQNKLRDHVNEVLMKHKGEISYEMLSELDYLEALILETLRIYPPVARVDRVCTKPYTLPSTNVTLNPGDVVGIPVYGIHMDPEHYPEPEVFRPERFLGEEKKNRPAHLYLAFGDGPRNCIGLRFAMLSVKLALVALIKNIKFSPCDKTIDPVPLDKRGILIKSEKGLWVHYEVIA